jgi:ubiquitin-conjugating enzyme E2 Z
MCSNPYLNEPSFEDNKDEAMQNAYKEKIQHETIRISVIGALEELFCPPLELLEHNELLRPEEDKLKETDREKITLRQQAQEVRRRIFYWYYDFYESLINFKIQNSKFEHKKFDMAPFEGPRNSMTGEFNYSGLLEKLKTLKDRLDETWKDWLEEGASFAKEERLSASHIETSFNNIASYYKYTNVPFSLTLELPDKKNPYLWHLHLLCPPDTLLDSTPITIRFQIPTAFPNVAPRAQVLTKLFHHCIAKDGTLAYSMKGEDDEKLDAHVSGIVSILANPLNNMDSRIAANPEAWEMLWGEKKDLKAYKSRTRKVAQKCVEEGGD